MDVYVVQHGQAVSEEREPARPLSDVGRAAVTRVARHIAALGVIDPPISEIWHSGKLRAEQTARILASALAPNVTPTPHRGMNPQDDPTNIYRELSAARERPNGILLAGHLPHLARLTGLLLTGDAEQSPVRLINAAVLRLGFRNDGWGVDWYVTPACVP